LSSYPAGTVLYLGFHYEGLDADDWYVDNIRVSGRNFAGNAYVETPVINLDDLSSTATSFGYSIVQKYNSSDSITISALQYTGASWVIVKETSTFNSFEKCSLDLAGLTDSIKIRVTMHSSNEIKKSTVQPGVKNIYVGSNDYIALQTSNMLLEVNFDEVLIKWSVENDLFFDMYQIKRDKTLIYSCNSGKASYHYTDTPDNGAHSYEIFGITNGKSTLIGKSKVFVSRIVKGISNLIVTPNPTTKNSLIKFTYHKNGLVDANVYDISGRSVFNRTLLCKKGYNSISISELGLFPNISRGTYFLILTDGVYKSNRRFVLIDF
ncbi:MAG: hypothetical protein COX48_06160, partial [bacterium (Candidatus Stahlbacteria) CG23_combo_of_CG06-09_8_20_14_all_34_7]